ncbi:hypothetical protein DL767_002614 [Monosporascus sp. MG133]|nr:hypothetical protein DL767_002614 [Monosporascus sp. MG133]
MDQASSQRCIGLVPAVVDSARGAFAQVTSAFAGVDHFLILVVFAVLLYVGLVMEMLREVTQARTASGDGDAGGGEEYDEAEGMHKMDEITLLKAALGRTRRLECIVTRETAAVLASLVIWIGYEKERARRKRLKLEEMRKTLSDGSAVADPLANLLGGMKWDAPTEAELCALIQYNVDAIVGDAMARQNASSSPAFSERDQVLAMSGISMHMDGPEDDDAMSVDEEPVYGNRRTPPPPQGSDNAAWVRKFAALQHSPFQELVERETRKALEQKGIWDPMSIDQGNCRVVGVDCIHRDVRNTADPHHLHVRHNCDPGFYNVEYVPLQEEAGNRRREGHDREYRGRGHGRGEYRGRGDDKGGRKRRHDNEELWGGYDTERRWRPGTMRGG